MYAINLKNKHYSSVLDSMPVISAIFYAGEVLGSKHVL
jgi:hypothetical protein